MLKSYEFMESLIRSGNDLGVKKLMVDENWTKEEFYEVKINAFQKWLKELDAKGEIYPVEEIIAEVEAYENER